MICCSSSVCIHLPMPIGRGPYCSGSIKKVGKCVLNSFCRHCSSRLGERRHSKLMIFCFYEMQRINDAKSGCSYFAISGFIDTRYSYASLLVTHTHRDTEATISNFVSTALFN